MALDALAMRCLTTELLQKLAGGRIDKIHQPEKDEAVLHIRTFTENFKLVLSANAAHPRIHFTNISKSNPMTPPMFCMLMRKHIGSGKITGITQLGFERIIQFDIETYDEFGELTTKHLIVEIMGRHSNIILTTADGKIIDSIKHIDFTISSVRQVLPGFEYVRPPAQNKISLISHEIETIQLDYQQAGLRADKVVMNAICGISPLTAREIIYLAFGRCDLSCGELSDTQKIQLKQTLISFAKSCENNKFKPCILTDAKTNRVLDFSAVDIKQYETLAKVSYYDSMNEVLDIFYATRDTAERIKQKSADLVKLLHTNLERTSKKLAIQKKTLSDAENKEQYKIYGDLLTSNLYRIEQGTDHIIVENYYEETCPSVKITLSPMLSPSQNAQKYYKLYNKSKTAEIEAAKQMEYTLSELEYLESTLSAVENAQNEADINAIRTELAQEGYLNRRTQSKKTKAGIVSKPLHYISSDGFDIYVGKNNTQNDYLTLKFANTGDLWFHTKNIHGSHTIIKLGVNKEIPDRTILEAATLAAYFSKGRNSSQVPVDYTEIKNVRKPNGAKPGMVIYDYYNTIYVTPQQLELENPNK